MDRSPAASEPASERSADLIKENMSEETQQTTFDLTCSDGTTFTLPSNHPEITAGGIGGVSYNAILADPSQIPLHFKQFAIANEKNRPPEPESCDLCEDAAELQLRPRCHISAPLRVVREGDRLDLYCYVPECNQHVATFTIVI